MLRSKTDVRSVSGLRLLETLPEPRKFLSRWKIVTLLCENVCAGSEDRMGRFVASADRSQTTLFPDCLDD
jgi:hypothetical protein